MKKWLIRKMSPLKVCKPPQQRIIQKITSVQFMKLRNHINAQFPICDYSCTRKTNLKKHIDTIHEGKKLHKPYKCSICDYSCTKKSNLDDHIYAVHEGKKPHQCYICDYSCATKSNMSQHINTVHEGKKPHKCSICD